VAVHVIMRSGGREKRGENFGMAAGKTKPKATMTTGSQTRAGGPIGWRWRCRATPTSAKRDTAQSPLIDEGNAMKRTKDDCGIEKLNQVTNKICFLASRGLMVVALAWICLPPDRAVGQSTNADTWIWMPRGKQATPPARVGASTAWTGTRMLIWGGQLIESYGGERQNDGYRYDVQADAWHPMTTRGAPSPRSSHTAVWTGKEMIVWGGADATRSGNLCVNTGARYDPLSDAWHPMTTRGAPSPRLAHTAVWAGKEMIVWGGGNYDQVFQDGGCYDPVTDTWKPLATAGAPPGRWQQSAVWTGQEMLVWGGNYLTVSGSYNFKFVYPAGLARYSPATDTWTPNPSAGAPTLRALCSAIWDGTEMIVWGGYNGNTYGARTVLNSGGRFNPVSGTWTPLSLVHAPAARDAHVGLWTGKEMIVWGGYSPGQAFNNGGRYDPAADAWVACTTNGAPSGGYSGEAVWTGEGMLVYHQTLSAYSEPGLDAWDGLPNDWQRYFFGESNPQALPNVDAEGDRQTNWQEYLAGTDPTNASSQLEFAIQPSRNITFRPWMDGRIYTLLASTNLMADPWLAVATAYTNQPVANGSFTVTNLTPSIQFFRLRISLP